MELQHYNSRKRRNHFSLNMSQWLRPSCEYEYFFTDSFHGCVFAIINNKPFVRLGNEGKGNARFDTMLGTYRLKDRMITAPTAEKVLRVFNPPIDWGRVNNIHDAERERGINVLKDNLT